MDIRLDKNLTRPLRESDITQGKFLEECDFPLEEYSTGVFTMVIFGGAGDLSKRKLLPTLFHLFLEKKLPEKFSILGFGSTRNYTDENYRELIRDAIKNFEPDLYDEIHIKEFCQNIYYQKGSFQDDQSYINLRKKIGEVQARDENGAGNCIFYMAVLPSFLDVIFEKLGEHDFNCLEFDSRVIVEKPFGRDRKSAEELNKKILAIFREEQIYRIDHYLGKETVQNIIYFRFSNSIFEPLWNRRYIDSVQITVAEELGVEHRGKFYEEAGVIRDIVQNHLLQLVALVAMEPPIGFGADSIRDEKVKVFHSINSMTVDYIDKYTVAGQYDAGEIGQSSVPAYRDEDHVDEKSNTATFFAAKFMIDNWRWAGVPFYVRTGKRMPKRLTEVVIQFKKPPLQLFGRTCETLEPGYLILTIQPQEAITMKMNVKYPNDPKRVKQVNMNFSYEDQFHVKPYPPYSRLLLDCLKGDLTLFVREDGIEALWDVVDPIIERWEEKVPEDLPNYRAGTWGPESSDRLLKKDGKTWITDLGDY